MSVNDAPGTIASEFAEFERLVGKIVPTVFGVIFVLGLAGNLLVIITVIKDRHMRNSTNMLILSLAIADLLFIVFCVPFTAVGYAASVWPFGNIWCKVVQFIIYVSAYASVYTLVLLSFERSVSFRNEIYTLVAITITWGVMLLANTPILYQYGALSYKYGTETRSACLSIANLRNPNVGKKFFGCFFAFGYVIPLGVICIMYGKLLMRVHSVVAVCNQSFESALAKKRVTRMVIIVVAAFAVCWLPIQIILMVQNFGSYPQRIGYAGLQIAANCVAYMNSCVNPFLYAFLSESFRRSFMRMICCFSAQGTKRYIGTRSEEKTYLPSMTADTHV